MYKNKQSKRRQRKAGEMGKQWEEKQGSLESRSQSRRDTWERGQDGTDAIRLWSVRNFRAFTDKRLYFLLTIVHLMRAKSGVGTS